MKNFETRSSRIEDNQFMDKFFDTYLNELEDMVTNPKNHFFKEDLEMVRTFRETRKISGNNITFRDLLVRVGQDFRLTPDEIDVILSKYLE
mgnify:CR=1 FL=1